MDIGNNHWYTTNKAARVVIACQAVVHRQLFSPVLSILRLLFSPITAFVSTGATPAVFAVCHILPGAFDQRLNGQLFYKQFSVQYGKCLWPCFLFSFHGVIYFHRPAIYHFCPFPSEHRSVLQTVHPDVDCNPAPDGKIFVLSAWLTCLRTVRR